MKQLESQKQNDMQTFPNGFTNWYETHHEVVSFIRDVLQKEQDSKVLRVQYQLGTGGLYELAKEWTDEFELKYEGAKWGEDETIGEYFDAIEEFCKEKNIV